MEITKNRIKESTRSFLRQKRLIDSETTQEETALIFGMSTRRYGDLENGVRMVRLDEAVKIADHYGITIDELIGRSKKEEPCNM